MLKVLPNRMKEGEKMMTESFDLEELIPFWSNRIIHISLPELDL